MKKPSKKYLTAIEAINPTLFKSNHEWFEELKKSVAQMENILAYILYTKNLEIIFMYCGKGYILSTPEYGNKNQSFFEYIYKNPDRKITIKELRENTNIEKKSPNKIIAELGFNGFLRKVFFPYGASSSAVFFQKEVSEHAFGIRGIDEKIIKKTLNKLRKFNLESLK